MSNKRIFTVIVVVLLLSLFTVFFINKETTYNNITWKEETNISLKLDWYKSFKKWVDIAWWVVLIYKIDFSDYEQIYTNSQQLTSAKNYVRKIIEKQIDERINQLWVSDYLLNFKILDGIEYVEIQIWWINDLEYAKEVIWKTVQLEFKLPYEWEITDQIKNNRKILAEDILLELKNYTWINLTDYYSIEDNILYFENEFSNSSLPAVISGSIWEITDMKEWVIFWKLLEWNINWIQWFNIIKYNWTYTWNHNLEILSIGYNPWYVLAQDPKSWEILNWAYFRQAWIDQSALWRPAVKIDFNDKWKSIWCNITWENVWKQLGIFVWWKLISDPVINEPICWWSTIVTFWTNNFEDASNQANELLEQLNYTLPVPLTIEQEEKISPLLWENAIKWAVIAWWLWLILIFFMMFYFYWVLLSAISITTIILFLSVLFAIIKISWFSLTLSWIAAVILSIWMAVDANVLIFERFREEYKIDNSDILKSIANWYIRSLSAIKDWNITTWFVWLLLFLLWTNIFKWFWTMMLINIVLTLFVVVPVTRVLLMTFSWRLTIIK